MNGPFILPVTYNGIQYEFIARFERWGYIHRIAVLIDEDTFIFEPDEEGGYRALGQPSGMANKPASPELLKSIAEKLVKLSSSG